MAFKIAQSETYTDTVIVIMPGSRVKNSFDVEFKRLPQSEVDALMKRIREGDMTDTDLCRDVIVGWRGVSDEAGELPYSETNRDKLLEVFPVPRSIVECFFSGISGAKQKN